MRIHTPPRAHSPWPLVIGGALSGRYGRYSRGAMDVLRDLVTPAGPLPVVTVAEPGDSQKGSTS